MTDTSREAVTELCRKFASQIGDDIREHYFYEPLFIAGAKTLAALLAERDALKAERDKAREWAAAVNKDHEIIEQRRADAQEKADRFLRHLTAGAQRMNELKAERDAALTRAEAAETRLAATQFESDMRDDYGSGLVEMEMRLAAAEAEVARLREALRVIAYAPENDIGPNLAGCIALARAALGEPQP